MTKARVGNDLPRPIPTLAVVLMGKTVPPDVQYVLDIIWLALKRCHSGGRNELFNRRMGQLMRRRPQVILNLQNWLLEAQTQQALRKSGHLYLVGCWLTAIQKFQNGTKASAAFNRPGRPVSWQFAEGACQAFQVEEMHRAGMPVGRAIETVLGPDHSDDRELRRTRSRLQVKSINKDFFI